MNLGATLLALSLLALIGVPSVSQADDDEIAQVLTENLGELMGQDTEQPDLGCKLRISAAEPERIATYLVDTTGNTTVYYESFLEDWWELDSENSVLTFYYNPASDKQYIQFTLDPDSHKIVQTEHVNHKGLSASCEF